MSLITLYAIVGTGMLGLLGIWVGAMLEASKCRRQMNEMKQATASALQELASKVEEASRPAPEPPVPVYAGPGQSLNLTRRARALHMHRRGDEPHTIAATLGISFEEMELLLKLDHMFQQAE